MDSRFLSFIQLFVFAKKQTGDILIFLRNSNKAVHFRFTIILKVIMMESLRNNRRFAHSVLLAVIMFIGITEISGFSYLDSLSSKKPVASNPPTETTEPNASGGYLDSFDGTTSEAVTPNEQYGRNDFGTAAAAATTNTNSYTVVQPQEQGSSTNARDVDATGAYFLEQYNTKNTFAVEASRKRRQPPGDPFFEPPTLEDASKMEESMSSQAVAIEETAGEDEDEMTETQKLMKRVKEAGAAGVVSYALWELGFWALSVPVCAFGYYQYSGHWPDLSDPEDQKKLGAEAFAFVNVARFAVPLRISLALGTTPWINENIIQRFGKSETNDEEE